MNACKNLKHKVIAIFSLLVLKLQHRKHLLWLFDNKLETFVIYLPRVKVILFNLFFLQRLKGTMSETTIFFFLKKVRALEVLEKSHKNTCLFFINVASWKSSLWFFLEFNFIETYLLLRTLISWNLLLLKTNSSVYFVRMFQRLCPTLVSVKTRR